MREGVALGTIGRGRHEHGRQAAMAPDDLTYALFMVNIHEPGRTTMYERAPNLSLRGSLSDQSNLNGVGD